MAGGALSLSPREWDATRRRRLSRTYVFPTTPAPARNTFAGAVSLATQPALRFSTAGAVIESNKFAEFALERYDAFLNGAFPAPGATNMPTDHVRVFSCQMYGDSVQRANVDGTAFVAIAFGTLATTTPNVVPILPDGVIRLEQKLSDPTQWRLYITSGNSGGFFEYLFTVPNLAAGANPGGHYVELHWDPWQLQIRAYVDYQLRALHQATTGNMPNPYSLTSDTIIAALLVFSGVQTAPAQIVAGWYQPTITDHDTGLIGSGLI